MCAHRPHTTPDPHQGESRLYRLKLRLAVALPLVVLVAGGLFVHFHQDLPAEITIATGSRAGTYYRLGTGMAELLSRELPEVAVRALESGGSNHNQELLRSGEAQLGFVQNNVQGDSALRTVARLHEEVLQIVVRRGAGISGLEDLAGKRINLGSEGSGTHELMQQVFAHYGMSPEQYRAVHLDFDESVGAFRRGELDAAVFVAGMATWAVSELFGDGGVKLLSLGSGQGPGSVLEGLCRELPGAQPTTIPAHTYGDAPPAPVGTVAVDAVLVTRRDAPSHLIRQLTQVLFQHRFQLASIHPAALEMSEIRDARSLRFPLHSGAANYYARNEPPFFVVYAEALSLGLTLAVSIGSAALAFREWRRRTRKNRIDRYYLQVEELSAELHAGQPSQQALVQFQGRLLELRNQAFQDLVAERLEANEAFSIFQASVNSRLQEIALAAASAPSSNR